jgi:hypothetical protein
MYARSEANHTVSLMQSETGSQCLLCRLERTVTGRCEQFRE